MSYDNQVSAAEAERLLEPPKRSKFNVDQSKRGRSDRTYQGELYDSKTEMEYAIHLDWLAHAGEIAGWIRQVQVPLYGRDGTVVCRWYADFLVNAPTGLAYHEVKGTISDLWVLKRALYFASYPPSRIPVITVTRPKGSGFILTPYSPKGTP